LKRIDNLNTIFISYKEFQTKICNTLIPPNKNYDDDLDNIKYSDCDNPELNDDEWKCLIIGALFV